MSETKTTEFEELGELTHAGLLCRFLRHPLGFVCGYVGVPRNHPFFGDEYHAHEELEVHGGLTFSGELFGRELWWFGFDCGHARDMLPDGGALDWMLTDDGPVVPAASVFKATVDALGAMHRGEIGGIRRPLSFAQREAKLLAEQLAAATK